MTPAGPPVPVGGLSISVRQPSTRPRGRVVFVHGALDRAAAFARVGRHLTDVEVVRYDRRGYGRSNPGEAVGLDEALDDLGRVIDDRRSTIVGHSVGGSIALAFAARQPNLVRSLLLFEAPTPWKPWWAPSGTVADEDPAQLVERFMRRVIGNDRWELLPESTRAQRRREGPALVADLAISHRVGAIDVARLATPTVVGAGTETDTRHRRGARELAADIDGAVLHEIPGAGHDAHLTHPRQFATLVETALALTDEPGGLP